MTGTLLKEVKSTGGDGLIGITESGKKVYLGPPKADGLFKRYRGKVGKAHIEKFKKEMSEMIEKADEFVCFQLEELKITQDGYIKQAYNAYMIRRPCCVIEI